MSRIITITFSPCIDKSAYVPTIIPEKKLKCSAPRLEPGGGGINVARAIKKLGGEAIAIYPAGGYTGKYFTALLQQEKVPVKIIESSNETRENIIILDESTNLQYRFGMPGTELKENEWQQCLGAIEEIETVEFIVASGSLPPGVPPDIFAKIAGIAKKKNARLIVDTSGEALKHAARENVYLLKPSLRELNYLAGNKELNAELAAEMAREIIAGGHCQVIVISLGAAGAMMVTKNEILRAIPPAVKIKSTVGAGDSMVAGIVMALSKNRSLKEVLQYGVACGTAATMNPGTELCMTEDVETIYTAIRLQS